MIDYSYRAIKSPLWSKVVDFAKLQIILNEVLCYSIPVVYASSSFSFQGLQCQERNLFLFNDLLLIAKERSSSHFKLKDQVSRDTIQIT